MEKSKLKIDWESFHCPIVAQIVARIIAYSTIQVRRNSLLAWLRRLTQIAIHIQYVLVEKQLPSSAAKACYCIGSLNSTVSTACYMLPS